MTSTASPPVTDAASAIRWKAREWALGAGLAVSTVAAYAPVCRASFVNIDDPTYVVGNPIVRQGLSWPGVVWAFTTGYAASWAPLSWLSHMLDCSLFGMSPTGPHVVNLALHAINVLLLFGLLRQMTGATFPSAWVAGLFALHPAHVESVAWIAERKDVLSTLFLFLSIWAYARWVATPRREGYVALAAFLALGLLCKPMLVTQPFVLLLLDAWPLRRLGPNADPRRAISLKSAILEKLPLFALVAVSSVVTFVVQQRGEAVASLAQASVGYRISGALVAVARYLGEFLWPARLTVYYPQPQAWPLHWVAGSAGLIAAISVGAWLARNERPWVPVGWLFFLGTLVPVVGLVPIGSHSIADRYTYVPFVGLFVVIAWTLTELAEKGARHQIAFGLPALAILVGLAGLTFQQASVWRNNETLFRHALSVSRTFNDYAHYEVGIEAMRRGNLDEARGHFEAILRVAPEDGNGNSGLGTVLAQQGKKEEAAHHFEVALRSKPGDADSHRNLGILLAEKGRNDEAFTHFERALQSAPGEPISNYWMGRLLLKRGDAKAATEHLAAAVAASPDNLAMRNSLVYALVQQQRFEEALPHMRELRRLANHDPVITAKLAAAYGRLGMLEQATEAFEHALALQPDDAAMHGNYGVLLAEHGRLPDAIVQFEAVVRLQPADPSTRFNLATALMQVGRVEESVKQFEQVKILSPSDSKALLRAGAVLAMNGRGKDAGAFLVAALEADETAVVPVLEIVRECALRNKREEASILLRELSALQRVWRTQGKNERADALGQEVNKTAGDLGLTLPSAPVSN